MNAPEFTIQTFQNEYLPVGGREVNAVITVTSAGAADAADSADGEGAAEIIIIDRSGVKSVNGRSLVLSF